MSFQFFNQIYIFLSHVPILIKQLEEVFINSHPHIQLISLFVPCFRSCSQM